jgi:predicted amidohydrolase
MAELLDLLGPGDVLAHCFHGKGEHTILGPDGRVRPEIRAARERGIRFDCANGVTNYNHEVAQRALDDGFMPDIVSSDLCRPAVERAGYARSLPFVLSKYLWLGMSFEKVVRAATAAPADALGLGGKAGTLSPGPGAT